MHDDYMSEYNYVFHTYLLIVYGPPSGCNNVHGKIEIYGFVLESLLGLSFPKIMPFSHTYVTYYIKYFIFDTVVFEI